MYMYKNKPRYVSESINLGKSTIAKSVVVTNNGDDDAADNDKS